MGRMINLFDYNFIFDISKQNQAVAENMGAENMRFSCCPFILLRHVVNHGFTY